MGSSHKRHICFLADKHGLYDDRIYWKMAVPLTRSGWRVSYVLVGPEEQRGTTEHGIDYHMLKLKTFSGNRYLNFLLKRANPRNNYAKMLSLAADLKADVYHLHDLWVNRIGPDLKKLSHGPVVFYDAREPYGEDLRTLYRSRLGWLSDIFAWWVDRWEKKQAEHYDLVIANEEKVCQRFRERLGRGRAEVLFNYPDLHHRFAPLPDQDKAYDLIYCGGITRSRGAMRMLRIVDKLRTKKPDISLLLLGRIDPADLELEMKAFIDKHHLEQHISLHEPVPYHQVSEFYNNSRIGLLLWAPIDSLKIKLPIKLFEYMTFGLPIVGSDFGHIGGYIAKDGCGIAVDPDKEEDAVEVIWRLLSNRDLYQRLSQQALERSHQNYRWEAAFKQLTEFYEKALRQRK